MQLIPGLAIEQAPVDSLVEHPRNARRGDVEVIKESLTAHGQYAPLVVQRSTRHVLKGNHTLQALRALNWTDAAVVYVDVDDDQALRILLVDNRSSDLGGYDFDALAELIGILDGDYAGTGYGPDDLAQTKAMLDALTPRDTQGSSASEDLPGWEAKGLRTIQLTYNVATHDKVTEALDRIARHHQVDTYSAVVKLMVENAPD